MGPWTTCTAATHYMQVPGGAPNSHSSMLTASDEEEVIIQGSATHPLAPSLPGVKDVSAPAFPDQLLNQARVHGLPKCVLSRWAYRTRNEPCMALHVC